MRQEEGGSSPQSSGSSCYHQVTHQRRNVSGDADGNCLEQDLEAVGGGGQETCPSQCVQLRCPLLVMSLATVTSPACIHQQM